MKTFMIAIVGLLLLTQCNTAADEEPVIAVATKPVNPLVGKWVYQNTIWDRTDLIFNDSTFQFHSQHCLGQVFTAGTWVKENGIIFLSSWDSYRPSKKEKDFVGYADKQVRKKRKPKKEEYTFVYKGFDETKSIPRLSPNDTAKVFFDKVPLQVKGDALQGIGDNPLIAERTFIRPSLHMNSYYNGAKN